MVKSPKWDQLPEVYYWLTKSAFDLQNYEGSAQYMDQLSGDLLDLAMQQTVGSLDLAALKNGYQSNPDSELLGTALAVEMMRLPYGDRDQGLLKQIRRKFDISA